MTTLSIKDSLRQSVEAASGGAQTVLYTAKGQPTYMNIVEKFDLSTINPNLSGTHPAFIINGVEKDKIFIGTYQGVIRNGELLSLPNVDPASGNTFDTYVSAARACGNGHHLMTGAEWAAIATKCFADNVIPLGNNYFGRSVEDASQFGRRIDGLSATAGITTGSPRTFTGSGPVSWRHNRKYNGISDLNGNINEIVAGVRVFNGELQIIENNDAALASISFATGSASWKAIDGATGNLVAPDGSGTTVGTVKFAASGTADYTLVQASTKFFEITNPSPTKPVSAAALAKIRALAMFPFLSTASIYDNDVLTLRYGVDLLMSRGGMFGHGAGSGICAMVNGVLRTDAVGGRPAYYTP